MGQHLFRDLTKQKGTLIEYIFNNGVIQFNIALIYKFMISMLTRSKLPHDHPLTIITVFPRQNGNLCREIYKLEMPAMKKEER